MITPAIDALREATRGQRTLRSLTVPIVTRKVLNIKPITRITAISRRVTGTLLLPDRVMNQMARMARRMPIIWFVCGSPSVTALNKTGIVTVTTATEGAMMPMRPPASSW